MIQTPRPMDYRTVHRQVMIGGVEVDEDIAELLSRIWTMGYHTDLSCQGRKGLEAYIQFTNLEQGLRFIHNTIDRMLMHTVLSSNEISRFRLRAQVTEVASKVGSTGLGVIVTFNRDKLEEMTQLWSH
jgi:hypothetical protein